MALQSQLRSVVSDGFRADEDDLRIKALDEAEFFKTRQNTFTGVDATHYRRRMVSSDRLGLPPLGVIVDLLNTVDLRTYGDSQRKLDRDELADPERTRVWLSSHGLLKELAAASPEAAAELRSLRDQLRAAVAGRGGTFARVAELEIVFDAHGSPSIRVAGSEGPRAGNSELLGLLAAAVLTGSWARLRICGAPDCQRAFFDSSRNGQARWCSMRTCGNRMKTRSYRQRKASPPQAKKRPSAPRRPAHRRGSSFRREGDYWSISYAGRTFRLRDSKGLGYIAKLIAEPGREFHVLDLSSPGAGDDPRQSVSALRKLMPSGATAELIDPTARRAYEARLRELRAEVAEADEWGDALRSSRAREEIDFLAAELKRATGLGGRSRTFASDSERARVKATRVVKAALLRIGDHSPELKHHFGATLKTGTYCSYAPDPRLPVRWEL